MFITLDPQTDVIVHQTDVNADQGVPVRWAIVLDDSGTYNVLSAELDDDEPWQLDWRGTYQACRNRYEDRVTRAYMGDLLEDLPKSIAPSPRTM